MNATKERHGRGDLAKLLKGARKVIVAKGQKSAEFALAAGAKPPEDMKDAMLGPTGNLRAPAVRAGTTWLVGFNADAWAGALG